MDTDGIDVSVLKNKPNKKFEFERSEFTFDYCEALDIQSVRVE